MLLRCFMNSKPLQHLPIKNILGLEYLSYYQTSWLSFLNFFFSFSNILSVFSVSLKVKFMELTNDVIKREQ